MVELASSAIFVEMSCRVFNKQKRREKFLIFEFFKRHGLKLASRFEFDQSDHCVRLSETASWCFRLTKCDLVCQ